MVSPAFHQFVSEPAVRLSMSNRAKEDVAPARCACRLAGWRVGVIDKVLLGLLVLPSRRERLPFGEAEQQARATDSSDE